METSVRFPEYISNYLLPYYINGILGLHFPKEILNALKNALTKYREQHLILFGLWVLWCFSTVTMDIDVHWTYCFDELKLC